MIWKLLNFCPKNHLSWCFGHLASLRLPAPLNRWLISAYCRVYQVNTAECEKQPDQYPSLADFFVRSLKPGLRPLPQDREQLFLSPCDSVLRDMGTVSQGEMVQVKGKTYSLAELMGDMEAARTLEGGQYFSFYLSPRDYHHVHAPVTGVVLRRRYIPGHLWPVNDWSLNNIQDLFSINERFVVHLQTKAGPVVVVMVGATNVGKMTLCFDSIESNRCFPGQKEDVREFTDTRLDAGDRFGTFHLGSTVLVICGKEVLSGISARPGQIMRFGERVAGLNMTGA